MVIWMAFLLDKMLLVQMSENLMVIWTAFLSDTLLLVQM